MESDYKPGQTGIITFGSVVDKINKSVFDLLGQWAYQIFEGGNGNHSVTFSTYNCCKNSFTNNQKRKTEIYQILSELNQLGPPWKFFKEYLIAKVNQFNCNYRTSLRLWMFDNWNKECHGSTITSDFF